jgi:hypothetical protein
MVRHKRTKELSEAEKAQFAEAIQSACRSLTPYLCRLNPNSDQYQAISRLNAALLASVFEVTGERAAWTQNGAGGKYG